ncbi:polymerase [Marinobacter salinexigens]|uniref:Polymerase n=1 Tax=Marinobacter salinexigens TaxID=2919747 RepID=A0A5B0VK67_9GAMM|nr:O-antigen ligase family protein [Marinobacter salinexigens]KAA1175052.1 polymerase [Marinobacter salinexigens]
MISETNGGFFVKKTVNRNFSDPKRKESKVFVFLVCVYILTWYLQLNGRVGILGAIRFEFILGLLLSASAVFVVIGSKAKPTPLKFPVFMLFFLLALYTVFSYNREASFNIFFDKVFKASMLALFFAAFIKSPWALKLAIAAFLLAMFKITQEGFLGWVTGSLVWENQGIPRLHGSTGMYRHPNSFSGLALGCIPFIYFLYPVVNKWKKIFLLVLALFCITIVVFTGSRTGYVGAALLFVYFLWQQTSRTRTKALFFSVIMVIVVIPFIPQDYVGRFESIFTLEEKEGASSEKRIQILEDAAMVFIDKPWGVGVGAFPSVRAQMFGRYQDTHNMYLELLTNMSIFGLAAFIFLVYKLISLNKRLQRTLDALDHDSFHHQDIRFLNALSKAIVAFLFLRLVLGAFGMDSYEIYWWFSMGVTISIYRCVENMSYSSKKPTSNFL